METEKWLTLDQQNLSNAQTENIRGIQINLFVSPYDVPTAVRGRYDESLKKFLIEFKYIADEPLRKETHGHLALRVGKRSGRLYAIEVDVYSLNADSVSLRLVVPKLINDAIESLAGTRENRASNYDIARQVISGRGEQLFERLGA